MTNNHRKRLSPSPLIKDTRYYYIPPREVEIKRIPKIGKER